jgi:hypothetical protein
MDDSNNESNYPGAAGCTMICVVLTIAIAILYTFGQAIPPH